MGLFSFLNKGKQDADDELDGPVKPRRRAKAQDEEPIDPMLPEKKRARRRLIGATALVLAAIIGLPMIFDSEPKPLTDDIAIQIPSRDKAGAPVNATALPPALPPLQTPAESAKLAPAPAPTAKTEPKPEPAPEKLPALESIKPAAEKPVAAKPADKPAAEKSATDKAAADKHADKDKSASEKAKSRFILQVAAVANKGKAEELQNRLKQAGIKSYSQKVSTKDGDRYRIRVGPFGSREEADKMRARLSKMGLSSTVQPV